ncbi:MAG: DNA-binding protein [Firmicutes bacterium]|nr:DNA-binding protein [Bacillota bacterium]
MNAGDELITAQELADSLSLSVDTIWRYTREKKIPFVEISNRQYRYNRQKVLKALSGETNPTPVREEPVSYEGGRKLTYSDYVKIPEEPGFQHEVINGILVRDPSPSFQHQRVSRRLQRILEDYFHETDPKAEIFNAPLDLNLEVHTVVQPDLMYLPGSRPARNDPVDSVPELIVEILSPSSGRKDRVLKLNHYQSSGVPHYWILDPEGAFIEAYELRDGLYVSMVRACEGAFSHPSFPDLSFNIDELFSKPG